MTRLRANRSAQLWRGIAVLLLGTAWVILGCRRGASGEVLARAGSRSLTAAALEADVGVSPDSLSAAERWRFVQVWVERALVEQEGERRGLDDDPDMVGKLAALRAELFRSRLLSEVPASAPADSALEAYYAAHEAEFLRPVDAYLMELYWAETEDVIARFRLRLQVDDTTLLATGEVSSEGRWLAEAGELPQEFEQELASLKPGEVTFARPYEDGYRVARLLETYPAGTVLDFSVVRDEIAARLVIEQSRAREDSLMTVLRERYPVQIYIEGSP